MSDRLSQTFAALADPTRRAMLARLAKGEANVSDLAKPFRREMSLPAVTKHLKVLEEADLILAVRRGRSRLHYLNPVPIHAVAMRWLRQFDAVKLDQLLALESESAREAAARAIAPLP